jgi:hypothetical protein
MQNINIIIAPLIKEMDTLNQFGFGPFKKSSLDNGRNSIYSSERLCDWRKDIIQMTFFTDRPDSCRIDFQVFLITEERDRLLAAVSVSDLRRKAFNYPFPKVLKTLRANKTIEKIIKDIIESLTWFDRFKNKHKCLEAIRNAENQENIVIKTTSKFFPDVERVLSIP